MNPKISTAEKQARGTYRKDRDQAKPAFQRSTLLTEVPAPDGLTKAEAGCFESLCREMMDRNELTKATAKEIGILCQLITHRDDLLKEIGRGGYCVVYPNGARQLGPEVTALSKFEQMITAKYRLLGLDSLTAQRIQSRIRDVEAIDQEAQAEAKKGYLRKLQTL